MEGGVGGGGPGRKSDRSVFSTWASTVRGTVTSCPGPVSIGRSGLVLRGEAWGTDVDLDCTSAYGCGATAQEGWGGLYLPGIALEMDICEVTGQHREGSGEM